MKSTQVIEHEKETPSSEPEEKSVLLNEAGKQISAADVRPIVKAGDYSPPHHSTPACNRAAGGSCNQKNM